VRKGGALVGGESEVAFEPPPDLEMVSADTPPGASRPAGHPTARKHIVVIRIQPRWRVVGGHPACAARVPKFVRRRLTKR
jgi:hypothetical protein